MNHQINFKEILRWASRNKGTTALSICGMAIGIAVALLIGFWSLNEFSFDKFHKDSDRIYRVYFQGFVNNESVTTAYVFGAAGTTAKEQFPEIEDMTRIVVDDRVVLKIKGITNYEEICIVDKNLFNFFSFKLETGNPQTCLDGPDKIVIDKYLANKYFARENPVGQIVEIQSSGKKFQVSAVMENVPENSHLKFHLLMPIAGDKWTNENQNKWGMGAVFFTYLKLKEGTNTAVLAGKITEIAYSGFPVYKQFGIRHFLQPLTGIHLSSGFLDNEVNTTDRRIVFIFISIAALILLIACFNFINLFISTSFQRAKSIGIKKISGSSKAGLFASSYLETAMYITAATLLAIIIVIVSLPYFNQLAGSNLKFDPGNYQIYLYTGVLVLLTMAVAGTIPVLHILRFNPEEIIHRRFRGKGISMLQRVLVVSQFAASIVLMSSAIIIEKQINYVQNKDLGFNNKQLIYFLPRNMSRNFETIREELMKNPAIAEVTAKLGLPGVEGGMNVKLKDYPGNEIILEVCRILYNYPGVLGIPVVEGRNPFVRGENHSDECMINEQVLHGLGIDASIGKQLYVGNSLYTIAGVLKNANTKSLHRPVSPEVYVSLNPSEENFTMMVKTTENTKGAIEALSAVWNKSNPDVPFEYNFLDEIYHTLYKLEETASKIISIGMVIALFLAFMGLYAISHYATERRTKEIGIRKVNGAKVSEVMAMLNKDFIKWVIIAFMVATPVGWYVMHRWLENFAYKVSLSWWIFALAGLMALGIALLTVSWRSWKAASRNPVEALRYE